MQTNSAPKWASQAAVLMRGPSPLRRLVRPIRTVLVHAWESSAPRLQRHPYCPIPPALQGAAARSAGGAGQGEPAGPVDARAVVAAVGPVGLRCGDALAVPADGVVARVGLGRAVLPGAVIGDALPVDARPVDPVDPTGITRQRQVVAPGLRIAASEGAGSVVAAVAAVLTVPDGAQLRVARSLPTARLGRPRKGWLRPGKPEAWADP